jgi:DNA-binding transcriptional regulator YhcF (GntR family)
LQIVEQVRHAVAAGAMQAGDALPSVRALASHQSQVQAFRVGER